ncbi:MAG: hypothetical protein NW206_03340 [Hyphomonadaceae bacterium]|nr:hypothetical protein [Hyphomonadaceae bacterium]
MRRWRDVFVEGLILMRIKGLLVAAASAALLAGCGVGAPDYPNFADAAYRIEGMTAAPDGAAPTQTVIYRDGPKMRVEAQLPQYGAATIVYDQATGDAYVLNPTAAPLAPAQPTAAPTQTSETVGTEGAPSTTTSTPAPTAQPAQAVGVAVRIADADAPQPLETAWAALGEENARSEGACEVAGESGHEWRPREVSAGVERSACITDDGIVLRVTENGRALWQATSLQRGQQDAALFGVPPGYQLINPQAVAEQVGEQMEQLDSVTGAAPAAPTTPPS